MEHIKNPTALLNTFLNNSSNQVLSTLNTMASWFDTLVSLGPQIALVGASMTVGAFTIPTVRAVTKGARFIFRRDFRKPQFTTREDDITMVKQQLGGTGGQYHTLNSNTLTGLTRSQYLVIDGPHGIGKTSVIGNVLKTRRGTIIPSLLYLPVYRSTLNSSVCWSHRRQNL